MQCLKCGAYNPDGAPQCACCGESLMPSQQPQQPYQPQPEQPYNQQPYQQQPQQPYYQQPQQPEQPYYQQPQQPYQPHPEQPYYQQPRQGKSNKTLLIILIVLVALLVGGVVAWLILGSKASKEPVEPIHDTVVITERVVETAPPAASTKVASRARHASGGDYSWVCTTRLTDEDLIGRSKSELRLMRNTIYARHGYIFKSSDLLNYFAHFNWYYPTTTEVPNSELSATERYNINLIKLYE